MGASTSNGYQLVTIDLTDATQVNSGGGSDAKTVTPPVGFIYILKGLIMSIPAPVGDTSGTHQMSMLQTLVTDNRFAFIKGNHSTSITCLSDYGFVGDSAEAPGNIAQQLLLLQGGQIKANNDTPLTFTYKNDTDAHQTGSRVLEILFEKHPEG